MPPRTLKAPVGVWFSCLTTTSTPVRAFSSGQANCGVGGTAARTIGTTASSSARVNTLRYRMITGRGGGFHAISAIIFFTIAWPNELWFSATMTNAPAPPITLRR